MRPQRTHVAAMRVPIGALRFLFVMLLLLAVGLQAQTINSARVGIAGLETATGGVWPSGDITFTINGTYTETIHYAQASSPESLAADFAALFTRDYAHVGLYAMAGADNVNLDVITFNFPSGQSCTSFSATATGTVPFTFNPFCGGGGGGGTTPDTGTVTLTVNGSPFSSTTYGATSTPASIAAALTGSNSIATVSASNGLLYIQANGTGLATDYPYSLTITSDTTNFPTSFYPVNKSGNLTGGADGGSTAAPTTIYCYSITLTSDGNCNPTAPSGYDAVGNIVNSTDSVMGKWAYTYDVLDRLATAAAATGPYIVTKNEPFICWSYDSFGNRTHQMLSSSAPSGGGTTPCIAVFGATTVADTSATYAASNQMTSVALPGQSTATAISYDEGDGLNRGNITADGRNTYLYDAEGRVCAVHGALGWTGYQYDAGGARIGKGTITSASCDITTNGYQPTSDFVLDESHGQMTELAVTGIATGTWQHTNVMVNGSLISTYDFAGLHFYLNDALGSRRFQTDAYGVMEQNCQNLPFGDQLDCGVSISAPTEHHFTGKERDAESGLDYFGARYYGSIMGRWMSPDWDAKEDPVPYAKLDDPQSLNLYGYVGNNPLSRADADGHQWPTLNQVKTGLDVLGFVPVVGDFANAASGAISLAQGHYGEAALSLAAAVPLVGLAAEAGKAAKLGEAIMETGVVANRAKGIAAEAKSAEEIVAEGKTILGSHVGIQTEKGLRVADHLVQDGQKIINDETKAGRAVRNASQVAKDESMATKGGKIVGKNAPEGLRGKTVQIETNVRKQP